MQYVAHTVGVFIVGLLTALVIISVLIYGNTKDIKRSTNVLEGIPADHVSTTNPRFEGLYQTQDQVAKELTFHIVNTGEINKEYIIINGQEEIISSPKQDIIIYDFSKGWMIAKSVTAETNTCFVSQFALTEDIEGIREALLKNKSDVSVTAEATKIQYRSTRRNVSLSSLLPSAARMCKNSSLIWFTEDRNNEVGDIEKRDSDCVTFVVLLPDGRRQLVTFCY